MKYFLTILLFFAFSVSKAQSTIEVVQFEQLQEYIKKHDDKSLLINFWATWCAPCIQEMPILMEFNKTHSDKPFKMLLVSLDSKRILERLPAFLEKHNINTEVLLLDDSKRMNTWIPAFEKTWQGNLPATIMYHKGEKVDFINGMLSEQQLKNFEINYLTIN